MFDRSWHPGVDFVSGLTAYYERREAHHRQIAEALNREWQEEFGLAAKYRRLAAQAAVDEKCAA